MEKKLFIVLGLAAILACPVMAAYTPFQVKMQDPAAPVQYRVLELAAGNFPTDLVYQGTDSGKKYINTFCLEVGDGFSGGGTYWATIDNLVKFPDNDNNPNSSSDDTTTMILTDSAKKIYAAYLANQFATATQTDLTKIQDAIYAAQRDGNGGSGVWTAWSSYSIDAGIQTVISAMTGNQYNWKNVVALNLWTSNINGVVSGDAQSQMGMLVPAPGAILLASMGMGLVGWLRRRQAL